MKKFSPPASNVSTGELSFQLFAGIVHDGAGWSFRRGDGGEAGCCTMMGPVLLDWGTQDFITTRDRKARDRKLDNFWEWLAEKNTTNLSWRRI